jgi:hypothetical protein
MCLEIIAAISPDAKSRISAVRLSELSGLCVTNAKLSGRAALHFSVAGGCSCEFLSDDADIRSPEWNLSTEHLPALASAVSALGRECKKFTFIAHWLNGERPRLSHNLSTSAIASLITENRVGNNVLYLVG